MSRKNSPSLSSQLEKLFESCTLRWKTSPIKKHLSPKIGVTIGFHAMDSTLNWSGRNYMWVEVKDPDGELAFLKHSLLSIINAKTDEEIGSASFTRKSKSVYRLELRLSSTGDTDPCHKLTVKFSLRTPTAKELAAYQQKEAEQEAARQERIQADQAIEQINGLLEKVVLRGRRTVHAGDSNLGITVSRGGSHGDLQFVVRSTKPLGLEGSRLHFMNHRFGAFMMGRTDVLVRTEVLTLARDESGFVYKVDIFAPSNNMLKFQLERASSAK